MSGGTPYIGSKISLLSKSDIRYVGILYSIDTAASTVTLANVRSFGTENRKVEREVPVSKEVYEFIVFRGTDIKDLNVSEAPKTQPQPTQSLPQDPAIVQSSSQATHGGYSPFATPNPYGTNSYGPFGGIPYYPLGMQQSPFLTSPGTVQAPIHPPRIPTPPLVDPMRVRTPTPPPPEIPPIGVSPGSQLKSQETQTKDQKQQSTQTAKKKPSSRRNSLDRQKQESPKVEQKPVREENRDATVKENHKINTEREDNKKHGNATEKPKATPSRRGYRGGGRGGTTPRVPKPQPEKVDGDFDFESANARFNKDEMEEEMRQKLKDTLKITEDEAPVKAEGDEDFLYETQEPDQSAYYDKAKSFFDNISCESRNERSRPNWQEERRLNVETFGISTSRRGGPRGRGRGNYRGNRGGRGRYSGRGGGSRGNWRGGRGSRGGSRGGRSERTWVDYDYDYAAAGLPVPENRMSNGPSEPSSTSVH